MVRKVILSVRCCVNLLSLTFQVTILHCFTFNPKCAQITYVIDFGNHNSSSHLEYNYVNKKNALQKTHQEWAEFSMSQKGHLTPWSDTSSNSYLVILWINSVPLIDCFSDASKNLAKCRILESIFLAIWEQMMITTEGSTCVEKVYSKFCSIHPSILSF